MPTNTAAWLRRSHSPLEVGPAPYTHPREHEIVVRNHAVAINPIDWIKQVLGRPLLPWIRLPFVLGEDVAGEVFEVGAAVTRFRVGDRVLGHAVGSDKDRNTSAEGAFQAYTVLLDHMAAPIPDDLSYERAVVLPLALSTAAVGLFQRDLLALRHPRASSNPTGETVLVWGGSTSVGSNAIQLAVAAGYDVIATASPHNADYVKGLGASEVFDYRSSTAVEVVSNALNGRTLAGAIAIGAGSARACLDVVHAATGSKVVATASTDASFEQLADTSWRTLRLIALFAGLLRSSATLRLRASRRRIRVKAIWGSTLKNNEVGPAIYVDFLPQALADHRYTPAPEPQVVGTGLEHVQAAFAAHIKGVSAQKIVITL